jgi:hypothetical protein
LSVTFKEYHEIKIDIQRGLFIGPPTIRNIIEGETLSGIAGDVLGDPGAWREIAELNNIDDPRRVPAGAQLIIPTQRQLIRPEK